MTDRIELQDKIQCVRRGSMGEIKHLNEPEIKQQLGEMVNIRRFHHAQIRPL